MFQKNDDLFRDSAIQEKERRLLYPKIRMNTFITQPSRTLPIKTTVAAFFMLICGTLFLIFGTYVYVADVRTDSDRGLAMLALGLLMFTPGSYATYVLYGAFRGWNGYDYSLIFSYDDD